MKQLRLWSDQFDEWFDNLAGWKQLIALLVAIELVVFLWQIRPF